MAALFRITEEDIARGLRERRLPVHRFDDLTREERAVVREYARLVLDTARRELLDMVAQAVRRRRGLGGEL